MLISEIKKEDCAMLAHLYDLNTPAVYLFIAVAMAWAALGGVIARVMAKHGTWGGEILLFVVLIAWFGTPIVTTVAYPDSLMSLARWIPPGMIGAFNPWVFTFGTLWLMLAAFGVAALWRANP